MSDHISDHQVGQKKKKNWLNDCATYRHGTHMSTIKRPHDVYYFNNQLAHKCLGEGSNLRPYGYYIHTPILSYIIKLIT